MKEPLLKRVLEINKQASAIEQECKRIDKELRKAYKLDGILHLECTCHWPSAPDGHLFLLSNPEEYEDRIYLMPTQSAPESCPA